MVTVNAPLTASEWPLGWYSVAISAENITDMNTITSGSMSDTPLRRPSLLLFIGWASSVMVTAVVLCSAAVHCHFRPLWRYAALFRNVNKYAQLLPYIC